MPNDERLQPPERIEDDVVIRGEITEEMVIADEVRRFGKFVEIISQDSEFVVRLKVGHQSFECFNGVREHDAAVWFREQMCRAIHNLVNDVIDMQADKIERLYKIASRYGGLIGTRQQILVLTAFCKQGRSVVDDLRALESRRCIYKPEQEECSILLPVTQFANGNDGKSPRADWCAPCCAKWILDRGDAASNA